MANKDNILNELKSELLELAKIWGKLKRTDNNGNTHCCTCGEWDHRRNLQGGHFMPCAKGLATKFELDNINAQCAGCNGKSNQGEQYLHGQYIDTVYGKGRADELTAQANTIRKRKQRELEEALDIVIDLICGWYKKQTLLQQSILMEFIYMKSRKKDCNKLIQALNEIEKG